MEYFCSTNSKANHNKDHSVVKTFKAGKLCNLAFLFVGVEVFENDLNCVRSALQGRYIGGLKVAGAPLSGNNLCCKLRNANSFRTFTRF